MKSLENSKIYEIGDVAEIAANLEGSSYTKDQLLEANQQMIKGIEEIIKIDSPKEKGDPNLIIDMGFVAIAFELHEEPFEVVNQTTNDKTIYENSVMTNFSIAKDLFNLANMNSIVIDESGNPLKVNIDGTTTPLSVAA